MQEEQVLVEKKSKEKKEQAAVVIGFFLILLIITITLFRSNLFSSSNSDEKNSADEINNQAEFFLGYKTISAKELRKKILLPPKDTTISLIDIRSFESYSKEHIVDSINITPEEFPINEKVDTKNLIIVIGENADDVNIGKTVEELKKENFQNFLVLADGMGAWKESGGTTVTYGDPNSFIDQSKVSYVDPEKLNEALKEKAPVFIIDVRSNADYNKGHIDGAINIPDDDLEKRRSEITEKRVVVVGLNELHEFQASVKIYDMLMVSPFVLRSGMNSWIEKGFPVVK